jgi:hypothetical protein
VGVVRLFTLAVAIQLIRQGVVMVAAAAAIPLSGALLGALFRSSLVRH